MLPWEKITAMCTEVTDMKPDWEELADMICEQVCRPWPDNDGKSCTRKWTFLTRMKHRLEKFEPAPFNIVSYSPFTETFYIRNYDYHTYRWAVTSGFTDGVDCNVIAIPKKDISETLAEKLMAKVQK